MPNVNDHPSPGEQLMRLEEEERLRFPTLSERHARARVADRNPGLMAPNHLGIDAPQPPSFDPGEVLNERAFALVENKQAIDREDGFRLAMKERPDLAAAWDDCTYLPADTATKRHSARADYAERTQPQPHAGGHYRHADPAVELMTQVREAMVDEPGLSVEGAQVAVLRRDPRLAKHYSEQTPLPVGLQWRAHTPTEVIIREALQRHAELQADLAAIEAIERGVDPVTHAVQVHYSTLLPAERERFLPRRGERRLAPGERPRAGEVMLAKMGAEQDGGGHFALEVN